MRYFFMLVMSSLVLVACGKPIPGSENVAGSAVTPPQTAPDEVTRAKTQLQDQIKINDEIIVYTERQDLGRLNLLKEASQRVLNLINEKGLSNMATIREYQVLIVTYRYSVAFFKRIETDFNREKLKSLLAITEQIVADRGFDDSPYTQITYSTFAQMHKLFTDLVSLNLSDELKKQSRDLLPLFGQVLALAKEGDRPHTFEAAKILYAKIKALYPEFSKISSSNQAFDLVISIQGLAEFYAEFAQIDP